MNDTATVLSEENPISLCSAVVLDDGHVVSFMLMPRHLSPAFPGHRDYGRWRSTYLYRRRRSFFARMTSMPMGGTQKHLSAYASRGRRDLWGWVGYLGYRRILVSLEKDIREMQFTTPPTLRLLWSDSGYSVALFLAEQPWAFIHETRNHGYSKGVLRPTIGNTWDEELFKQTFTEV